MKQSLLFLSIAVAIHCSAQSLLLPGDAAFDKKRLIGTKYEMAVFAITPKGNQVGVSDFTVEVIPNSTNFSVYTSLRTYATNEQWIDTSIADAITLKPVYRSSYNPNRSFVLKFGKEVTGFYFDHQGKTKSYVKESVNNLFFDSYVYPYLLGALPLQSGYRADMRVYEYTPVNNGNIKNTRIEEVKSSMYKSDISGEHKVWQVSVFEEATNEQYEYYIDKETRRIWRIEILAANNQRFLLINKEIDFGLVVKTVFDKDATMKLLKEGSAVIKGVAYAKDNPANETFLKNKSLFNINKKQYAPLGTSVILIPATAYFKEWISVNEQLRKKARPVPLSKEAAACIKVTTVYDEKGNFEFTNLKPGEYYLYTEFAYLKSATHREVVGYTDTYINGFFQGSTERTKDYTVNYASSAGIKQLIEIKMDGETLSVILKKTGSIL